jgi:hypothetical protein
MPIGLLVLAATVDGASGEGGFNAFVISIIAALVVGGLTTLSVDWDTYRGRWMAITALVTGVVWLLLVVATTSTTPD